MIYDVPNTLDLRDQELRQAIGLDLRGLAMRVFDVELDLSAFSAICVPITSGQGVTKGFSDSVCAIARHIGLDCHVESNTDVTGICDAIGSGVDIIFMADDNNFVALNTRERKIVNNVHATALGYCTALEVALGGLESKDVLVIGAGRLGWYSIELLQARGANVTVVESNIKRAEEAQNHFGVVIKGMEDGVRSSYAILNVSPSFIPGEFINEGSIVSSPGMPYSFDPLGENRIRTLIHDPLQIGVSTMAVWSAAYTSIPGMDRYFNEPCMADLVDGSDLSHRTFTTCIGTSYLSETKVRTKYDGRKPVTVNAIPVDMGRGPDNSIRSIF